VQGAQAQAEDTAPSSQAVVAQAVVAKETRTKDELPPTQALQDTLANALAAGPVQAAAGLAAPKPQAASGAPKPSPITPAEAALAATRPSEAASRLAQAFNATETAKELKLAVASETAEVSLQLTSLEAPKTIAAKPSGEARAEALPMARQLAPVVVSLALGRGDEALTIALDPVELGRVEVSIGQGKEAGQVRIVAERPETLALLQRDQRELDRALNQSGLGDMARSLSFSLASDQQRQQYQGSPQRGGQRAFLTISGVEADRAMPTLPSPLRNPNALVDIAV
jgi:Meckel syndrome type 1 protein